MNTKLFGIVAVLAVLMSVSALADVTVHGLVKEADGATDAVGVEVTVECDNGEDVSSDSDETDVNGEYAVTFTDEECGLGSTVVASVPGR